MWDKRIDTLEDDAPEMENINGVWVYKASELQVDYIYKDGKEEFDCGYWYSDQDGGHSVWYSIVENDFDIQNMSI